LLGPLGSQRKNIERETGFCLSLACCHYYGVINICSFIENGNCLIIYVVASSD